MKHDNAARALAKARAFVKSRAPYLQTTLYSLIPRWVEGLGTLAVSEKLVLIIDPEWFEKLELEVAGGCLLHEIMHVVRGLDRIHQLPDRALANIAADLPINTDLRRAGWKLPKWAIYPETFGLQEGLTLEEYYSLLSKMPKQKLGGSGSGDDSDGDGKDGSQGGAGTSGGGKGKNKSKGKGDEPGGGAGSGTDKRKVAGGGCGSCAGETPSDEEQEADVECGRSAAERQRIRKQTLQDISEAAHKGGGRGSIPSSLLEDIEFELKPSIVPWRQELRQVVRRTTGRVLSGRADYSMRRVSKRSYVRGILRPGMIDRMPEVLFVRDTSGSMGEEELSAANSEVISVFKQVGLDFAWFIDADASVQMEPRRVRVSDIPKLQRHGCGGTDFGPAIAAASRMKPRPDILIYLTDGDGYAPDLPPPQMAVIWCIVPSRWNNCAPAPWGKLIIASDDINVRKRFGV